MRTAKLALEDGLVLEGRAFGAMREVTGELVFNTSMFGYEEILTDPSYAGQIVVMAATQMGNVGTNAIDQESRRPQASGMVVRELSPEPSSWRAENTLDGYLGAAGVAGVEGLDTRMLVRHLRNHGSKRAVLTTDALSDAALVERARNVEDMQGQDLVTAITTPKPYAWTRGSPTVFGEPERRVAPRFNVVAYDYGLKRSMLELLVDVGCKVTVVPAAFDAKSVMALRPDGVFLTNGPGDPAAVPGAREAIRSLLGHVPVFGICLGHQLLALALGGQTYKMKFGHRGANHPVVELATGRVEITSQNHGFAVDASSLQGRAVITHLNVNDDTVEGLAVPELRAFSVQYHPEASPGPHDARHLMQRFTRIMAGEKIQTPKS